MSGNANVMITGSSSGFEYLPARTLLENGYTVVATMRDLDGKNASRANELRDFADGRTGTLQLLWGGMAQQLQGENAPDPQVVADAILTLIETPAGQRPLRTVVDPMIGGEVASAINQTTD